MRLTDLIVENTKRSMTGSQSIDKIFEQLSSETSPTTIPDTLPISAKEDKWKQEEDPQRLIRSFTFTSALSLKFFIDEVLNYQEEYQHHPKITINIDNVTIETYTRDANLVTEVDLQLARFCDDVYEDIKFIRS